MTYIACEYARLLFELGIKYDDVKDFADKMESCPELCDALASPVVTAEEKSRIIKKVFSSNISAFAELLCSNNRAGLYKDILKAYKAIENEHNNIVSAQLFCVNTPTEEDRDKIKSMLVKKYGAADAQLDIVHNSKLLGGFVLKVGDTEYDKSCLGALKQLKKRLNTNGGERIEHN